MLFRNARNSDRRYRWPYFTTRSDVHALDVDLPPRYARVSGPRTWSTAVLHCGEAGRMMGATIFEDR